MSDEKFEQWAIVELFGHSRIAGLVTEHSLGGCNFVRVDVPAVNGFPEFTKLYGNGAIYAISFVDRDIALAAVEKIRSVPVTPYDVGSLTAAAVRERLEYSRSQHDEDFN